jgi:hypothetical protein
LKESLVSTDQPDPKKASGHAHAKTRAMAAVARYDKLQKQLDDALDATFPASDPVSIVTSQEEEDWGNGDHPRT